MITDPKEVKNNSTASKILSKYRTIVDGLADLIRTIPIRRVDLQMEGVVFIAPPYSWTEPTSAQRAQQLQLKRAYEPLAEMLKLLLRNAPDNFLSELETADEGFRIWLELGSNWNLMTDSAQNERSMRQSALPFEQLLAVLEKVGDSTPIVVPDTNSILSQPDPTHYRQMIGLDKFTFLLIPTVLGELDRLKLEHKVPEVREKAKKAILRIKGWRQQGNLPNGVLVDRSLIIRTAHEEPDVKRSLSWLDNTVPDDRIVASVISAQAANPAARVVLVTGDINLQNKADAAFIETCEVPES